MAEAVKYGVGNNKIDKEEAIRLRQDDKWSYEKIGQKYGVTKQAVAYFFKKLREDESADIASDHMGRLPWPWKFNPRHTTDGNSTYAAFLSLLKMENGRELRPDELTRAKQIRKFADTNGLALSYDPDEGFKWVSRRPGEEDAYFVSRP